MYEVALLFAGHRVDAPGRQPPRFPPRLEPLVLDVLRLRVGAASEATQGSLVGIASAARGSDILFLEVCRDLGLDTRIVLPEPPERFVKRSVAGVPGSDWADRFGELWSAHAPPEREIAPTLPGQTLDEACNARILDLGRGLGRRIKLLSFWDGQAGDGPGGTASFVALVANAGGEVEPIDAGHLLSAATEIER